MKYMQKEVKIIYIDGEERYREKARSAFGKGEYKCLLCCTGLEGLDQIEEEKPDVVVVDYFLPDISGEEVYTRFLMDARFAGLKDVPFIALTNNGKVDKSKLYSLGFSACLSKPFRIRELFDYVEDVLVSHVLKMEEAHYWETIRQGKDFLERVVESSADAIVTTDTNGCVTYCNRASEDLLGIGFEEIVGKRVNAFLFGGSSELMKIADVLKKKDKVQSYKTNVLGKDGEMIPISLSISKMRNGDGNIFGIISIGKKLGEEGFSENYSYESDRLAAVVETAVAVNHAINNPLVPILGNAQFLLANDNLDDEDVRRRLKIIVSNARRIHDVTRKLARITHPVTKEYLKGTRMLDIEASAQMN